MTPKKMQTAIAVAAALVVIGLFFVFANPFAFVESGSPLSVGGQPESLVVQDEVVGTGAEATAGSLVTVNYTGRLENGTVFDTSVGRSPLQFPLGIGYVIKGWDQGLQGMKVGGKRILIIPSSLGYGAAGNGPIPGNATLIFEVELLKVEALPTDQ